MGKAQYRVQHLCLWPTHHLKIFLHLPRFAFPWQGNAYSLPGSSVCPTLLGHSCYLSCRFRSFSLRPPASALLCRPWFRPASAPALHAGSASFSCPTSGGAVFHQGSAAPCVQVTQKYSRTLCRGQDLSSSGSQSSPSAPLNLKQSIQ